MVCFRYIIVIPCIKVIAGMMMIMIIIIIIILCNVFKMSSIKTPAVTNCDLMMNRTST